MIKQILSFGKTIVFEKSRFTYYTNLKRYRRSFQQIQQNKGTKEKIKIGFMCQLPDIWISLKPVYEAALKDPKVEAVLLAIPQMRYAHYTKIIGIDYKQVYDFTGKISNDYIQTYNPQTKEFIDMKELDLDYVFLPRPYETYLPKKYRAKALSDYTRVCYVPYAFMTSDANDCCYNTHFVRNVYMTFCEVASTYKYVTKKLSKTVKTKEQRVYQIGFPRFDLVEEMDRDARGIWKNERDEDRKRIIWTPRWAPYKKLGGSNFLKYKDVVLDYALENKDGVDLVFRPHPLTFQAFMDAGLISKEEVEAYKKKYADSSNAVYDHGSSYLDTFYSSDILITDDSSIIVDYLFTKNPIVFCPGHEIYDETMLARLNCYYIVRDKEELLSTVNYLREGIDPKKEVRESYVKKMKPDYSISERIIDAIKKDYWVE